MKQSFLGGNVGFTLGGNFAYKNVARMYFRTYADNTLFVKIAAHILAHVGYIVGNLFRTQFGIPRLAFIFFTMNGGEDIVPCKSLGNKHSVLVVVAVPRGKAYYNVAPERKFAVGGGRTVGKSGLIFNPLPLAYYGNLIYTGALV